MKKLPFRINHYASIAFDVNNRTSIEVIVTTIFMLIVLAGFAIFSYKHGMWYLCGLFCLASVVVLISLLTDVYFALTSRTDDQQQETEEN